MAIYIITGDVHEGKTTYAEELATELKNNGLSIGGFLSLGFFENNKRSSFDIKFLSNNSTMLLAKRGIDDNSGYFFGEYNFNPIAFSYAINEFRESIDYKKDFIFIDEVGKYELLNGGFIDILNYIKTNDIYSNIICVTRKPFVNEVNNNFFNKKAKVINISQSIESTVKDLLKHEK